MFYSCVYPPGNLAGPSQSNAMWALENSVRRKDGHSGCISGDRKSLFLIPHCLVAEPVSKGVEGPRFLLMTVGIITDSRAPLF